MAMIVILAYDVAADSRRTRLAAALESWGYRIQESVFQLRLEEGELDEVRERVNDIIDSRDDVVHLYPLCANCLGRAEVHGTAPALDDGGLYRGVW
ncbi:MULTISPECIES: CRISPR-associated endonuclease Cas2 [Actinomyces]|uniref:CRISPR-associated endoribonuclease Cas2 n=1 Tax=Actinomyces ruminicola TaxID=332524 RepID=A0A1G9RML2_9ACTO|nr:MULTISPECIES: CRISPR-associated endonuclease Cas2 [Actinomyces]SDM24351.1 CRISPR-associated protein Cas2 [Actinomyces ruminicola]